jgi:predicted kinase
MSESRIVVVQMHGEPGSGKSTVARALAPRIDALVLDKDIIKAALLRSGANEALAASGAYETYFNLSRSFVEQGQSVILDNPVYWTRVEERWLELSAAVGCPPILVECVCPDRQEIARRLATRNGLESQPRDPLDIKKYPNSRPTPYQPRITLDTTARPLDDLVGEALVFINERLSVAPQTAGVSR